MNTFLLALATVWEFVELWACECRLVVRGCVGGDDSRGTRAVSGFVSHLGWMAGVVNAQRARSVWQPCHVGQGVKVGQPQPR